MYLCLGVKYNYTMTNNENLDDFERKKQTTITLRPSLSKKAREAGINVSEVTEQALERELVMMTQIHYTKGLEAQNSAFKGFLLEFGLLQKFEDWKFATKEEKEALLKKHEDATIDEILSTSGNNNSDSVGTLPTTTAAQLDDNATLLN